MLARAASAGWHEATPIQRQAIPAVLRGGDVLGLAPTGSGKTAAYLLPLLQRLQGQPGLLTDRPRRLRALVLAPTRELAAQIGHSINSLAPALKTEVVVGGVSANPQMMALRGGAHLVVATPGRLLDLLAQNALQLSDLHCLVLDEADRLLDLGFAEEVGRVLAAAPKARQTLLFSATFPSAVAALAAEVLRGALRLDVRPQEIQAQAPVLSPLPTPKPPPTLAPSPAAIQALDQPQAQPSAVVAAAPSSSPAAASLIVQRAVEVDTAQRTLLLRQLIKTEGWRQVLVFVATQYAAEHVADKLRQASIAATALHGRQSNTRRAQALADLERGAVNVLVATDLAARGIDIPGLPVVINHDLPRSPLDHSHRIGRTGRAGQAGLAISFICTDAPGSEAQFRLIEKRQGQRVAREQVAGFEPRLRNPATAASRTDPNGGVKGQRPNKKDRLRALQGTAPPKPP